MRDQCFLSSGQKGAGAATVRAEVEAAGFRLLAERPLLDENYFLEFARD